MNERVRRKKDNYRRETEKNLAKELVEKNLHNSKKKEE
jgi:hypothetical protein